MGDPNSPQPDAGDSDHPSLIAYEIPNLHPPVLVAAPASRAWMDATDKRFANRCLPMLIANQAGWLLRGKHKIAATWNGGQGIDSLGIRCLSGDVPSSVSSHFGGGILTFSIPFLFRTPPGWNLLVRGPSNWPKDGISPLEGIVETDWTDATFTMNWMLTRANHTVIFEIGEPIAMIVPQPRGFLEKFRPSVRGLDDDPQSKEGYEEWARSRQSFNSDLGRPDSEAARKGWQKDYMQGTGKTRSAPDAQRVVSHQTSLELSEFYDLEEID